MEWLNYHHLLYFWTVAKEGSIARACGKLSLAQPTISGQLRMLEDSLGEKLFTRVGRGLALTDEGRMVFGYAEEIFGLGRELQDVLKGRPSGRRMRLTVGISDLVPKLVAHHVLQPVLSMPEPVHLICHEDSPERLMTELAEHHLDMVLSDAPAGSPNRGKMFSHLLGSCNVNIFCAPTVARRYRSRFPACLDGAPFLLPLEGTTLRRNIDEWFDSCGIRPAIAGEFKDSALLQTFAQAGAGLFFGPAAIAGNIRETFKVVSIGQVESLHERFYAISMERRLRHPAIVAITQAARGQLFVAQPAKHRKSRLQ